MKKHTTNYHNTFIEIAEDCPTDIGLIPPIRGNTKSIANHQFELLSNSPYQYTSDDVLYKVYAIRKEIDKREWDAMKTIFFSKGQPCFRASPLPKRYGWGVHSDELGRIAIYAVESEEYDRFLQDSAITKIRAMRSKR